MLFLHTDLCSTTQLSTGPRFGVPGHHMLTVRKGECVYVHVCVGGGSRERCDIVVAGIYTV